MSEREKRYEERSVKKEGGASGSSPKGSRRNRGKKKCDQTSVIAAVNLAQPVVAPSAPLIRGPVKMPSRLKYTKFRGDGSQDVDDWMEQYLAILFANDEADEATTKKLFRGIIEGEALRWYGTLTPAVRDDWPALKAAFEQEFCEIGADSRVMARLNTIRMKPKESLRSYTQRVHQLIGKLEQVPPASMQLEWFVAGLPELLDFEVRKADPQTFTAAIEIAKRFEKSALLSGKWTEKKLKKKVTFVEEESDEDSDDAVEDRKPNRFAVAKTPQAILTRVVKDEFQTLRKAIEDVNVQMADIKKNRRPIPQNRTNVWCTRCKKEGHFSHDCQTEWRMIQEEEMTPQEAELLGWDNLYAIQGGTRGDSRNRQQGGSSRIPGTCWECGEVGHYSPACPNRKPGEYILLCSNCREEGHKASMCQKPVQI